MVTTTGVALGVGITILAFHVLAFWYLIGKGQGEEEEALETTG